MTKKQQASFIREWQARLGLADWYIIVQGDCTPDDFPTPRFGEASYELQRKKATIRVLAPKHFYGEYTWTNTIIHELLELAFASLVFAAGEQNGQFTHEKECVIETLSRAIIGGF